MPAIKNLVDEAQLLREFSTKERIAGAGVFGFYLSILAKKTGTIWWGVLAHILGGMVMIV